MSKMIEVKTADLIGPALDWAVASAIGGERRSYRFASNEDAPLHDAWVFPEGNHCRACTNWSPSADWGRGGPLIAKYGVLLSPPAALMHVSGGPNPGWRETGQWGATIFGKDRKHRRACFHHKTEPLVAAMRAIVQFEFGDVVQVPAELLEASA